MSIKIEWYDPEIKQAVNYWKSFDTAEAALQWLFENHPEMKTLGGFHVVQSQPETMSAMRCSGWKVITPDMLKNRLYTVAFSDSWIAIHWHDQVMVYRMENRLEWPGGRTQCQMVPYPTNKRYPQSSKLSLL